MLEVISYAGFDATMVNASGNTALHLVCMADAEGLNRWRSDKSSKALSNDEVFERQLACIKILVNAGCPGDALNNARVSPMDILDRTGNEEKQPEHVPVRL